VTDVSTPDPELLQKADLGAGEMYDQMQKRDMAMKKYQSVLATNAGNDEAEKSAEKDERGVRE